MLNPIFQRQFANDIKKIKKRSKDIDKLKNIITLLIEKKTCKKSKSQTQREL